MPPDGHSIALNARTARDGRNGLAIGLWVSYDDTVTSPYDNE